MTVLSRCRALPTALTALAMGTAVLTAAPPASADPAKGQPVLLECDNGQSYVTVVRGNGNWTPVHDTASNSIFIPTSFGEQSGTITDEAGNVVEEFTEPPSTKGASEKARGTATSCTFSVTFTFEDPDLGLLTGSVSGDVSGFYTPLG